MNEPISAVHVVDPAELPDGLREWLAANASGPLLISLEPLPDGRLVLQALPDVDPALVARIRKILAQYADVLRRLT